MAIQDSLKTIIAQKLSFQVSLEEFLVSLLIAVLIVIAGIFTGKIVKFALRKLSERAKFSSLIQPSFIKLFLTIVKWSIYILFIDIALIQLNIPTFTLWLTTILGVIPALTGALIIISAGFAIASYLKKSIEESKIHGWDALSNIFYFFVIYIFLVFAVKTALMSLNDKMLSNILVVIFTSLGGIALLIHFFSLKKK